MYMILASSSARTGREKNVAKQCTKQQLYNAFLTA